MDSTVAATLIERAILSLESHHPGTQWGVVGQPVQCRKSIVIPVGERAGKGRAGLKVYSSELAAERQAVGLRYAAALNNGNGHAAPVLYDHIRGDSALLVEWVAAPHLETVLIAAAARPTEYRRTLFRVGEWLRHFHALGEIAPEPFVSARYSGLLATRVKAAGVVMPALQGDRLWCRSVEWLGASLAQLDGVPIPFARTHGDFTFTNVLVSPERVTGIDIWAERRLPLAEDLARMFVYLAMGDLFPLRARVSAVPLAERRAQQGLLQGYGGLDSASSAAWEALVCFEALARWLALEERLARRRSFPDAWKRAGIRGVLTGIVGRG